MTAIGQDWPQVTPGFFGTPSPVFGEYWPNVIKRIKYDQTVYAPYAGTSSTPTVVNVTISNPYGVALDWTATKTQSWVTLSGVTSGHIEQGDPPQVITVTVDPTGKAVGAYLDTLTITASGADNSPLAIPISMLVGGDHEALTVNSPGNKHCRRYLHLSNTPALQVMDYAAAARHIDAITLQGPTQQPTVHNLMKATNPNCRVGCYLNTGYADEDGSTISLWQAPALRAAGWLAKVDGSEFVNPFGGVGKAVDLGLPGVKEYAADRIINTHLPAALAAGSAQQYDYVFLDDVNAVFNGRTLDGYTDTLDYVNRAMIPFLTYVAKRCYLAGLKFIVPNLGDWLLQPDEDGAAPAAKAGWDERGTNGVPHVELNSPLLARQRDRAAAAAANGWRIFWQTQLLSDTDAVTARYGWAMANILGEFNNMYHGVSRNGWYGKDLSIPEHDYILGNPTAAPSVNLTNGLISRTFDNGTVYANAYGVAVTLPDSSSLGPLDGKFYYTDPRPVNTAAPVASGTPQVGSTLSTTDGSWSGSPTSFTRKWQRSA